MKLIATKIILIKFYITEIKFHLEIAEVFAYVGHSFANRTDLKKKIVHICKSLKFFSVASS